MQSHRLTTTSLKLNMPDSYKTLLAHLTPSHTGYKLDRPAANKQRFEELVQWIDSNLDSNISLNDLIQQSGLSMYELTQQFMLNAKLSPLQFVKELKKYKAAMALAEQQPVDNTYALFDPQKNKGA
jgi:AraC-like DNA-binding protein